MCEESSNPEAADRGQIYLNGICPYFTMFPLNFPRDILRRNARKGQRVLDPFCGRGTTNFAARTLGLQSLGIDSSPVAVAVTAAKIVSVTAENIIREAEMIMRRPVPGQIPASEFWRWAFHPRVLGVLVNLRTELLSDCRSAARQALRGVVLGAIHGPKQKRFPGYFSNQCTRTYSPKPGYALKFWQSRDLFPDDISVSEVIERRVRRYYSVRHPALTGDVRLGDSRSAEVFWGAGRRRRFDWVITSPPYYGMRTYVQDQWLRNWFLGGPEEVDYATLGQLEHKSPAVYTEQLRKVWQNTAEVCRPDARMVVRFGAIRNRDIDPCELIKASLRDSGWRILTLRDAGTASKGKRQADAFLVRSSKPVCEYDVWATLA